MSFSWSGDHLAWNWERDPWDFELMLSYEPERWGVPVAVDFIRHGGVYSGHDCRNHVLTVRLLCGALHFSFNRVTQTVSD